MQEDCFYKRKRPDVSKYVDKQFIKAFDVLNRKAFKKGALSTKTKELIAVACAHITRCPYCISGHSKKALKLEATKEEIGEAIAVAISMSAGAPFAHMHFALE